MARRGAPSVARLPYRSPAPLALQLRAEEADHRAPRAVGHFRFFPRPQESVPDSRIHRVRIVLPRGPHGGRGIWQAGIDARIVLRVHAEALGADLPHIGRVGARTVTHHEGLELGRVGRVPEALTAAPTEADDADLTRPHGLQSF